MVTFVPAIRQFAVRADEVLRELSETALHPYRRELHYMRGPGPKWHAKHDPKPEGRTHEGPLTRALDLVAHRHAAIVEARASQPCSAQSRRRAAVASHRKSTTIVRLRAELCADRDKGEVS